MHIDVFVCLSPFSKKASDFLARRLTIEDALSSQRIVKTAVEIVESALKGEMRRSCDKYPENVDEAAATRLALYIISASGNQYALRRFADRESKHFSEVLRRIDRGHKIEIATDLGIEARPTLDIMPFVRRAEAAERPATRRRRSGSGVVRKRGSLLTVTHPIAVYWVHYLKYAPQDPDWAMINRPVVAAERVEGGERKGRGWVLLEERDFERLLEEAYEARILELAAREDIGYISSLLDKIPEVADLIKRLKAYKPPTPVKATGEIPPCMQAIMDAIKRGENAPHMARFAITTYLLKRGWDIEQIVDLFRSSPDFNEKITRYQVSHIAGKAGGRTEYSVPGCDTMNSWGFCPTNLGCGIRNPIAYGARRKVAERTKTRHKY